MEWLTETRNIIFRPRVTFESAKKMFYSDYESTIADFRQTGSAAADERAHEVLSNLTVEEVLNEQQLCLEEQERAERSEKRLVNLIVWFGLWDVIWDNLALIAIIVTFILVFVIGFHPLLFLIPIGAVVLGFVPYLVVSLFCNFRLTSIYYTLGWDEQELEHIRRFWEQNLYEESSSSDTEATSRPVS